MVPRAFLRIFEPLDVLPDAERERWSAYVAERGGVTVRQALAVEEGAALARLVTGRWSGVAEGALVRRVGGRTFVCPLRFALRAAHALRELREEVPEVVVAQLLPDPDERRYLTALDAPGTVVAIRERAWVVPLAWFTLFDPVERHLVDPPEGRGPRLSYLTRAAAAVERVVTVRGVVEEAPMELPDVLRDLDRLIAWLAVFDPGSLVELDYGTTVSAFEVAELRADRTCADVAAAVEALDEGDLLGAAAYYGVARSRWSRLRGRSRAS